MWHPLKGTAALVDVCVALLSWGRAWGTLPRSALLGTCKGLRRGLPILGVGVRDHVPRGTQVESTASSLALLFAVPSCQGCTMNQPNCLALHSLHCMSTCNLCPPPCLTHPPGRHFKFDDAGNVQETPLSRQRRAPTHTKFDDDGNPIQVQKSAPRWR
jgi:hypothetical protein